jgi:pimeloyl-ACP methyl ester carboxylesterase
MWKSRIAALGASLALGASGVLATSAVGAPVPVPDKGKDKPTVVLVHGAFAESSSWNGVVSRLQRDGYPVVAAANPLRDLQGDAAYVRAILRTIDGPIVLVGHSYGGSVITNAATGNPNVKALVYVAGFAPDQGETANDLLERFPGSTLGAVLEPIPLEDGSVDLRVGQDKFHQQFAADTPEREARLMAVAQRPVSAAVFEQPTGVPAWRSIPSYFLIPTADNNIPPAAMRFMADRANGTAVTVRNASHAVLVSQPDVTTRLVERAAHNTK